MSQQIKKIPFFNTTLILALVLGVLVLWTKTVYTSANDLSRLLTVQSIADHNSLAIQFPNNNHFPDTIYNGTAWYSDKPALLSIVAGWTYAGCRSLGFMPNLAYLPYPNNAYYFLTLLFSGLPFILLLFFFAKALRLTSLSETERLLWLSVLAFGTLLLPYATIFSNHVLTACLMFVSFYLACLKPPSTKSLIWAGLIAGLLPAIDVATGSIWSVTIFLIIILKLKKIPSWFILGALPGAALTLYLHWLTTGTLLPMYLVARKLLLLPENSWRSDLTPLSPQGILLNYWRAFFGLSKGLFIYTPIIVLGWVGLIKTSGTNLIQKSERWILLTASLIYLLGVIGVSTDLGGVAYGFRWSLPLVPIWIWFAADYWTKLRTPTKRIYLYLIFVGFLMAVIGLPDPWNSGFPVSLVQVLKTLLFR